MFNQHEEKFISNSTLISTGNKNVRKLWVLLFVGLFFLTACTPRPDTRTYETITSSKGDFRVFAQSYSVNNFGATNTDYYLYVKYKEDIIRGEIYFDDYAKCQLAEKVTVVVTTLESGHSYISDVSWIE